jgi:hypothetical protein
MATAEYMDAIATEHSVAISRLSHILDKIDKDREFDHTWSLTL